MTVPVKASAAEVGLPAEVGEAPSGILGLLHLAIERGVPVETLERLEQLHERVVARAAAAQFARDLAAFQRECPPIPKTSTAQVVTTKGAKFSYRYAELDEIARTVTPRLSQRGMSWTWDSEVRDGMVRCTCTLRHENGHAITATFAAPVESSAGMSEQQKHAAALTYARRQSLIQVLGLTTTDPDTDGAGGRAPETITAEQVEALEDLIAEVKADKAKFLRWLRVERLEDVPVSQFQPAVQALRRKGGA